jgi:hypothetical protein
LRKAALKRPHSKRFANSDAQNSRGSRCRAATTRARCSAPVRQKLKPQTQREEPVRAGSSQARAATTKNGRTFPVHAFPG